MNVWMKVFIVVSFSIVVIFSAAHAGIDEGLVGYFPFNGNANDVTENGNDGTVFGATLTLDRFGSPDSAYLFDGINDYIDIPDSASLDITTELTVSLWIKQQGRRGGGYRLVDKDTAGEGGGWVFDTYGCGIGNEGGPGDAMRFCGAGVCTNTAIDCDFTRYSLNNWHHLVVVFQNGVSTFYLDGVYDGTGNHGGQLGVNDLTVRIGYSHGPLASNEYFYGALDDVRIYNRALSDDEVWELYNQPVANAGPDQIVCNEICNGAVLDGRKSYDPNSEIVSYVWELKHRENPSYDLTANGETPAVLDLEPGFYDVTLTVTDSVGLINTDEMELVVLSTCNGCAVTKGDLDSDGDVDGDDLRIFSQNYGTIVLTP